MFSPCMRVNLECVRGCVSVLPCDGLATCPEWTPPLTPRLLERHQLPHDPLWRNKRNKDVFNCDMRVSAE
ncbi:hypothetical protein CHARACLAT_029546 [Characodon lateralis]|uniref:Secreted protein n=1 Tax=Characodon lateralis TaxID=208331 RepID=A0ABU7CWC2_9TELE|nr:hypothetical protein [Characodon lateralis]